MAIKRLRPHLDRACKMQAAGVERRSKVVDDESGPTDDYQLALDPKLWTGLPEELAYKVLSFLPLDTLVETLRRENLKCENQLWFHTYFFHHLFGHGKNLASSYVFMMGAMRKLLALEHESMQWRKFPMWPQKELSTARLVSGSCDGLLLCESKKCLITDNPIWDCQVIWSSHDQEQICVKVAIWNLLISAFKWLPLHPKLTNRSWSEYCHTCYHVVVDESSRTYKVFVRYIDSRTQIWHYSIYSRCCQAWSNSRPMPIVSLSSYPRFSVASDRYVCIVVNCYSLGQTRSEDYFYCYDTKLLCWDILSLSKPLTDLAFGRHPRKLLLSAKIASFAILHGLLYMVVHAAISWAKNVEYVEPLLTSLDLSMLGVGDLMTPVLKLESVIPMTSLKPGIRKPPFDIYTYTMKGKGFVAARPSNKHQHLHFDMST